MRLSQWFRQSSRPPRRFRPTVALLEDRIVLSGTPPGPAAHLRVIVPESVQSGSRFDVLVEAEDASNQVATGYTGFVSLSLGTPDSKATLPAAYTFTAADHGEHLFSVTLVATGSQTIKAADTHHLAGSAQTTVTPAPVLAQLLVVTSEQAAVGVPTAVTVEALDAAGHLLPSFTGVVQLTSSDTSATGSTMSGSKPAKLPPTYTFTASDHGEHTFQLTFNEKASTKGTLTTVTATAGSLKGSVFTPGSIKDQASLTVYPATVATHFGLTILSPAVVGSPTEVKVVALNAANQVVPSFTGTVSFTSTDPTATVSATAKGTPVGIKKFSYTFTAGDAGSHDFWLTFDKAGEQSITVTDAALALASSMEIYVRNKR